MKIKLGKLFRKAKKVAKSDEAKAAFAVAEAVAPVKAVTLVGKVVGIGKVLKGAVE